MQAYLFCKQNLGFRHNLLNKSTRDGGFEQSTGHLYHSYKDYDTVGLGMLRLSDSHHW